MFERSHMPVFHARPLHQAKLQWKRMGLYALVALSLVAAMWFLRSDKGCEPAECVQIVRTRKAPPKGPMSLQQALKQPVSIAVVTTDLFADPYVRLVPCEYEGHPFYCEFLDAAYDVGVAEVGADAFWYHMPNLQCKNLTDCLHAVGRSHPWQLTVGFSMEGPKYYYGINKVEYMDMFDIEMTYRLCSQVPVPYFDWGGPGGLGKKLFAPPLSWEEKTGGVVFVNSNCEPPSNRTQLVQALMQHIPVDAWGWCLRNVKGADSEEGFDKIEVMRKYKFCITVENSVSHDYVTEKVWHGLQAGCIPIYYGAANIRDFVPTAEAVIDYREVGGPAALADLIKRLSANQEAYEARLAWKHKPLSELLPGFQKLVAMSPEGVGASHSQCTLCQQIIKHRVSGQPRIVPPPHCLRNESWVAAAATTSHIITAENLAQPAQAAGKAAADGAGTGTHGAISTLVSEAAAADRGSVWQPASDGLLHQLAHHKWPSYLDHPQPGEWGPLRGREPKGRKAHQ